MLAKIKCLFLQRNITSLIKFRRLKYSDVCSDDTQDTDLKKTLFKTWENTPQSLGKPMYDG